MQAIVLEVTLHLILFSITSESVSAEKNASDEEICNAFEKIDQARGDTSLSYFEFGTLAAMQIFSESDLDVAIY